MKVRSAVRRLCRDCYVVKKKRVVYIRCKTVKKHKQRQGLHTEASVLAMEGWGHPHGSGGGGASRAGEGLEADSWLASSAAPTAESFVIGSRKSPAEIMSALPWLPSWATTPSFSSSPRSCSGPAAPWPASTTFETGSLETGSGVSASTGLPSGRLSAVAVAVSVSPLTAVGAWGSAVLGGIRSVFGR